MIANVKEMLEKAHKEGYAVGAFNTVNLETTRAIIETACELRSPVIVEVTEKTFDFAGGRAIFQIIKNIAEFYAPDIPVGIHLDHGKSFEVVERAIDIGFPSVMYDGSRREMADNLMMTKKIVEIAHAKGIVVQAEVGNVPYIGEVNMENIDWEKYMTDPEEAARFVEETGVDTLAVAIGNAHGFFEERSEPDMERLKKIRELVTIPIIMHGSSDWKKERIRAVIEAGVSGFNVDTAIRLSFLGGLRRALVDENETDIRKVMNEGKLAAKVAVQAKIESFGSAGKV